MASTSRRVRPRVPTRTAPIDKLLPGVVHDSIDATQQSTVLITATFPCTVTGLRWELDALQQAGTAVCTGRWAIIIARDGSTVNTMSISDGAALFEPEQDCLAFGTWLIRNNTGVKHFSGSTKTMRKLKGGDRIICLSKGIATETSKLHGVIQLFCKT